MAWGDNEKKMIPDMAVSAAEMLEASGAKNVQPYHFLDRVPGYGIHEVGVARMGDDPKTSVLNQYPAGARRQEPVRDGRRVLPVVRVPEPDADDHGAGRAFERLPDAGDEARQL